MQDEQDDLLNAHIQLKHDSLQTQRPTKRQSIPSSPPPFPFGKAVISLSIIKKRKHQPKWRSRISVGVM